MQLRNRKLVQNLLAWFADNARPLPWRRAREPYAIWVSEIMLQQTQVKTALPYWERWMGAIPTIEALAKAAPERIHKLWEGLGYYTRVRNMQKAAQLILQQHGGRFPERFDEVLALPGIGRYTAGAICSIAFGQPQPILDGNVIRVLTRIFAISGNPREKEVNARLWQLAEQLVRHASQMPCHNAASQPVGTDEVKSRPLGTPSSTSFGRIMDAVECKRPRAMTKHCGLHSTRHASVAPKPGEGGSRFAHHASRMTHHTSGLFNQSLMELGALICTPRQPQCSLCPVARCCTAYKHGRVQQFPNPVPRPRPTARRFIAFVAESRGRFLVRQRPPGLVNGHLWEFPNAELAGDDLSPTVPSREERSSPRPRNSSGQAGQRTLRRVARSVLGFKPASLEPLCTVQHTITRYRITLEAFRVRGNFQLDTVQADGRWLNRTQLRQLPFSSAHKKILQRL